MLNAFPGGRESRLAILIASTSGGLARMDAITLFRTVSSETSLSVVTLPQALVLHVQYAHRNWIFLLRSQPSSLQAALQSAFCVSGEQSTCERFELLDPHYWGGVRVRGSVSCAYGDSSIICFDGIDRGEDVRLHLQPHETTKLLQVFSEYWQFDNLPLALEHLGHQPQDYETFA